MDAEKYPESAKLLAVSKESQTCGELLEWLTSKGFHLCEVGEESNRFYPVSKSITTILAEFFEIDLEKRELEVRAMLEEYQNANY